MNLVKQVAFIQFAVQKGACDTNLSKVRDGMERLTPAAGTLVVLPELWGCGYDYPKLQEHASDTPELLKALEQEAGARDIIVAGSLPELGSGPGAPIYNSLFYVDGSGVVGCYRKQHLFSPMAEDDFFTAGKGFQPILLDSGVVASLICYDLRFPEIARSQAAAGAGLLVVAAQWPTVRLAHWRILLQARAIENQLYVAACNRCGESDGTEFAGHSMIIAPDGEILSEAGSGPTEISCSLDLARLTALRGRFKTVPGRER